MCWKLDQPANISEHLECSARQYILGDSGFGTRSTSASLFFFFFLFFLNAQ